MTMREEIELLNKRVAELGAKLAEEREQMAEERHELRKYRAAVAAVSWLLKQGHEQPEHSV